MEYRLSPIIIGHRLEGWQLQNETKFLCWKYWVNTTGEDHMEIRFTKSQLNEAKDLVAHLTGGPVTMENLLSVPS